MNYMHVNIMQEQTPFRCNEIKYAKALLGYIKQPA